eukprot:4281623-Prymnesium_polylepis.1
MPPRASGAWASLLLGGGGVAAAASSPQPSSTRAELPSEIPHRRPPALEACSHAHMTRTRERTRTPDTRSPPAARPALVAAARLE